MTDTSIAFVHARRVWDSRGRPTVEADVLLEGGAVGGRSRPPAPRPASARRWICAMAATAFGGYDVTRRWRT